MPGAVDRCGVGGGNSAGQAAVFLAGTASHVYLVVRARELGADMSRCLVDRVEADPRIIVLLDSVVRAVEGRDRLQAVVIEDRRTGECATVPIAAMFSFIGAQPGTDWLAGTLALDDDGAVLSGRDVGSVM